MQFPPRLDNLQKEVGRHNFCCLSAKASNRAPDVLPPDTARASGAVELTIRTSAPDLIELPATPALNTKARFGLVTMASRSNSPMLPKVRDLMRAVLRHVS